MFRKLLVLLALAGATASVVVAWPAHGQTRPDDQNCDSFPSQAAAQQHLRNDPSDPDRLDEDNNGLACENYEYPSGSSTDTIPVARSSRAATTITSPQATTQPTTTVTRSGGVAETGPRDYVGLLTLFGVMAIALGVAMRGQRPNGAHWSSD